VPAGGASAGLQEVCTMGYPMPRGPPLTTAVGALIENSSCVTAAQSTIATDWV
jgi:hypothetical protein